MARIEEEQAQAQVVTTTGTEGAADGSGSRNVDPQTLGQVHDAIENQNSFESDTTNNVPNQPIEEVAIIPQGHVSLAVKKTLTSHTNTTRRLATAIAANTNATVTQNDEYYIISGAHIFVRRADVEEVTGALTNTKWRMMLVKREGEVKNLTDTFFELGEPLPAHVESQSGSVEYAQINTRITKSLKDDMVELVDLMGWSQTDFIGNAISELVAQIKSQM